MNALPDSPTVQSALEEAEEFYPRTAEEQLEIAAKVRDDERETLEVFGLARAPAWERIEPGVIRVDLRALGSERAIAVISAMGDGVAAA
jgi:hypothetical protein